MGLGERVQDWSPLALLKAGVCFGCWLYGEAAGSLMAQSQGSAGAPRGLCACVTKRKRRGSYSLISNPGLKTQLCPQGGDLGQVPSQI